MVFTFSLVAHADLQLVNVVLLVAVPCVCVNGCRIYIGVNRNLGMPKW
jgi:hypothetical protein